MQGNEELSNELYKNVQRGESDEVDTAVRILQQVHKKIMPKFKFQFHVHTAQDPVDRPFHTEKEMIDAAAKLGYNIVATTCHNKVVFDDDLKNYAAEKGILLIPGIERDIEKRHVLIINATPEAEKIQTFEDLRTYRKAHPDCFVIAPHPFYFTWFCLREKFEKNLDCFDAVEYSWYHTESINSWNQKAEKFAQEKDLPMIATSDNHILVYFDRQYSFVDAEEKTWEKILTALKSGKIEIYKNPLNFWQFVWVTIELVIKFDVRNRLKRLWFYLK